MCKKRAISFLLAGLLAIMPIMNVQAEETTESGEATRHMPEDDMADENSLVIVVDTNRPKMTECEELLHIAKTIVVLDSPYPALLCHTDIQNFHNHEKITPQS